MERQVAVSGLVSFLTKTIEFEDMRRAYAGLGKQHIEAINSFQAKAQAHPQSSDMLNREYAKLGAIPEISRYLQATERYAIMFEKVIGDVTQSLKRTVEA